MPWPATQHSPYIFQVQLVPFAGQGGVTTKYMVYVLPTGRSPAVSCARSLLPQVEILIHSTTPCPTVFLLQGQNPNVAPNQGFADGTSLLAGEWKLLFTSALDVLSLGLIPGVDVGQVFQNISEDGSEVTLR